MGCVCLMSSASGHSLLITKMCYAPLCFIEELSIPECGVWETADTYTVIAAQYTSGPYIRGKIAFHVIGDDS